MDLKQASIICYVPVTMANSYKYIATTHVRTHVVMHNVGTEGMHVQPIGKLYSWFAMVEHIHSLDKH